MTSTTGVRLAILLVCQLGAQQSDWPAYGGGPAETRYSALKQIDRSNVSRLRTAWTYDTEDGPGDPQTQPIVVNGVLYGLTPKHKLVALDAATGNCCGASIRVLRGVVRTVPSSIGPPAPSGASSRRFRVSSTRWMPERAR